MNSPAPDLSAPSDASTAVPQSCPSSLVRADLHHQSTKTAWHLSLQLLTGHCSSLNGVNIGAQRNNDFSVQCHGLAMCVHHRARVQVQWSPNECARGFLEDKVCLTNVILQTLSRLPAEPKRFLFTRHARGYLQQRPRFYKADSTPDGCACRDVPALPVGDWHHLLVPDHLVKDTVLKLLKTGELFHPSAICRGQPCDHLQTIHQAYMLYQYSIWLSVCVHMQVHHHLSQCACVTLNMYSSNLMLAAMQMTAERPAQGLLQC